MQAARKCPAASRYAFDVYLDEQDFDKTKYQYDYTDVGRDHFLAILEMTKVRQLQRIADALERMSPPTTPKATSPEATVGDVADMLNELNKNG